MTSAMSPGTSTQRPSVWRRSLRALARVASTRATPAGLGWAVFAGIIIGTTPFIGLQLALTLVVCAIFRLNPVVTYLAANISLPPMIPLLAYGSIQFGHIAYGGHWLSFDEAMALANDPWQLGAIWVLGSLLFGATLGAPLGIATFLLVSWYRRLHPLPPDPAGDAMELVAERYRTVGRFAHGYVRGKLRRDPVYRQIAERQPLPLPFVDVGCGRGQTGLFLATLQPGAMGIGSDWDAAKIDQARCAAAGLSDLRFEVADMATWKPPQAGTLFLLDVLHYHELATQDAILERAAAAVAPGGVLFVRDVDASRRLRAWLTRLQEAIARGLGLNRGRTLFFRRAAELTALLDHAGLVTTVHDSFEGTPLGNVLIEARRPVVASSGNGARTERP